MADRVVTVRLSAQVANYVAGMEKATKATRETGSEAEKLAQKKEAFELLGRTAFVMGSVIAAGVGLAIVKFAEFDQAMSNVKADTQETAENMGLLRQAALDFGASSVFTATEAANAIDELGKAGLSTADILSGGLEGALNLASAGQLGVAEAAGIAATAMKTFNLRGSDMGHVSDLLAAGAGKAMGDVSDLSMALSQAGLVANATGLTIEETTGALAAFAAKGLLGSDAGTAFKSMLQRLTPISAESKKEMDRLGISAFDAAGEFIGMESLAGNLRTSLKDLTVEQRAAALTQIFGSDAVRAANVLYEEGAAGIAKWNDQVNDSGFAARVAADRLDNLRGDVEQLGGAFDTALITTGSAANDVLRTMAQALTNLLDLYNAAPEPVKAVALAVGALAAVALLAGGAFFLGVPQVAKFTAALATMGPTAQRAGALLTAAAGPIGIAFAVAGAAVAIWAGAQAVAKARTDAFSDTLDRQTGAVQDSTRELVKANLATKDSASILGLFAVESDSAFDAAGKLGINLDLVTDAALGNADAVVELDRALRIGVNGSELQRKQLEKSGLGAVDYGLAVTAVRNAVDGSTGSLSEAARITRQKASVDREATKKADEHAAALGVLEGKAEDTTGAVDDLADTIRGFGSATLSVREATRGLEEAYDALTGSVIDNGNSLDITTDAGRANQSAIDDVTKSTLELAAATVERTGRDEDANAVIATGRERLIAMLAPFGIVGDAANAYANELGLIPGNVGTAVTLNTADAQRQLDDFFNRNDGRVIRAQITGRRVAFASGGPTGDSIPATAVAGVVHGREWVSKASTVAIPENRRALEFMHRGGVIRGYLGGGFVQPQFVQSVPRMQASSASNQPISVEVTQSDAPIKLDRASIDDLARTLSGYLRVQSRQGVSVNG